MKKLLNIIENIKNSEIRARIESRIKEFESFQKDTIESIFKELCFCIMTANCAAEKCIQIHDNIGNNFLKLTEKQLSNRFIELGYRFPNIRAKYIVEARKKINELKNALKIYNNKGLREWISKNILGLGYKESSHFLRNIGYKDLAIIDFHIIDLLERYNLTKKPKNMSKKIYLEIEAILEKIAHKLELNMAELDLYLWYIETGKILK